MVMLGAIGDVNQLTAMDAAFLYAESSRTPMHIGSILIYDQRTAPGGKIRYRDIMRHVESRLHLAKTFRQKILKVPLGVDHPYWVDDDDFDIEYHIRHFALPQPGDWRQLCILAARLHSRCMDLSRPLWEFNVVEGLDNVEGVPKGAYAMITKVHHAAIDGVSGAEILSAIHTLDPNEKTDPPEKEWMPGRSPGSVELLARTHINNVSQPFRALQMLGTATPGAAKLAAGLGLGNLKAGHLLKVPATRFNKKVSAHRVVGGRIVNLAEVKGIRKAVEGPTLNDVVLTVCGGALRKYLDAKGELPKDPLVAMAPISVRKEGEKTAMGNQVSAMFVQLGSHIGDPLERLVYVHEAAKNSKALTNAIGARQLTDMSSLAPALLSGVAARLYTELGVSNLHNPLFNTVITNVPGPPVPIYCAGARLVAHYGLGPIYDGMGLIHPIFSYAGELVIAFNSCRKMMPDPEFYDQCIAESFAELRAAAGVPEMKKAAASAGKSAKKAPPARAAQSANGAKDKLTNIKGVGPAMERKLHAAGVYRFAQIANLSEKDAQALEESGASKGRIAREKWIDQARELAK